MGLCRRRVLSSAGLLASLLALRPAAPLALISRCAPSSNRVDLASCIRRRVPYLFADRSMAAAIGDLYLEDHPEEADVHCLLRRLTREEEASAALFVNLLDIDTWLAERIAQDLRDGDLVLLAGWVMARSEARLCVLADPSRPCA
jgi:hypothetical protein